MKIRQFFTSGRWRLWAVIGVLRIIVLVVVELLGLDWIRPVWLMEQVLYPDVWLLYRDGVDADWWFLVILIADTVLAGYVIETVTEHLRRKRHKPAA